MQRWQFWSGCLVAAILCAAGTLCVQFATAEPSVRVTVHSLPEGATAFLDSTGTAITPFDLTLRPGEVREVRLMRKDFKDADLTIRADDFVPKGALKRWLAFRSSPSYDFTVSMPRRSEAGLIVLATPEGTEVFLNGAHVGSSPLSLRGLPPGPYALRLAHPDSLPHVEDVVLTSGETLRIERALENRVEAFYREAIRKEPGLLTNYAELAHHLVAEGAFDKAASVLRDGMAAVALPSASQQTRFFSEIAGIYTRYFNYPPETATSKIRPAVMQIMKEAYDKGGTNKKTIEQYLRQMEQYDSSHPGA